MFQNSQAPQTPSLQSPPGSGGSNLFIVAPQGLPPTLSSLRPPLEDGPGADLPPKKLSVFCASQACHQITATGG